MTTLLRRFLDDEGGATAIEYALITGMIFLVIVASIGAVASKSTAMFDRISAAVSNPQG